ncbi:type III-B CRISPR module RAMP protein Cmr6 [Nocardiopsis lambiniae]|uniref:Type III-B CRISPR module RAMP protein Cmr6 n=1 Tax=Nocardiopsis lambiniae TaxID=3075539 RepID=A0ABU2M9K5_9ACTN|nr:type III-B CRISPR module RAMP protein Cmr6 [Nocardiopsis sp. DSM 44743]MDT0329343.1 type III-B CRISPR module RAMP protein Cmr6 [Nocardiopsis sp. DSM 44743]
MTGQGPGAGRGGGFSPKDFAKKAAVRADGPAGTGTPAAPGRGRDGAPPREPRRKAAPGPARDTTMPVACAGPLRSLLQVEWDTPAHTAPTLIGPGAVPDANALIVLRRTAFVPDGPAEVELPQQAGTALLRWAQEHDLGQVGPRVAQVARRREFALERLADGGAHVIRVLMEPEWRVAVGLGERSNAHELGISLHGTYGWPIIPGSGLKGAAAAYAWSEVEGSAADVEAFTRVFGTPLPSHRVGGRERHGSETGSRGRVRFLDAFASGGPVTVSVDVLTPHVKPYYDTTVTGRPGEAAEPPAEHHQPVPVNFLTVSGGTFATAVVGDDEGTTALAARWLTEAVADLGVGAKTGAGYGYMNAWEGSA